MINFINNNFVIGVGLAFLFLGLLNIFLPQLPLFSVRGNNSQTRKRGVIRLIMAMLLLAVYYFKMKK